MNAGDSQRLIAICMFRYVALVWSPSDVRQLAAAQRLVERLRVPPPSWHEASDQAGFRVFFRDARPGSLDAHILPDGAGVIVGTLFERTRDPIDESPARKWTATTTQAKAIVASRGRWLIENCWGNYVAFGCDSDTLGAWVLKDPTGELPCFVTSLQGVAVIFSCIGDLVETGLFRFTIRYSFLATCLLFGCNAENDALENVEQVCRGECVEVGGGTSSTHRRQFYWHPATFAESLDVIEDAEWAARALRATVRSCTRSWATLHDSLVHRLSGGLDSSIIAACLRDLPNKPRTCCYTYYNPHGRSDERPWARLAAKQVGCEHVELPVAPKDIHLERVFNMPLSMEPVPVMGYLLRSTLEQSIASEHRATAVFNGEGGDSGFGGEAIVHALPDYLRRHGIRGETFLLATQIAMLTEQSSLAVFGRALRRTLCVKTEDPKSTWLIGSRLLSSHLQDAYSPSARYPHPWFRHLDRVPWSTIQRLGTLLATPRFYDVGAGLQAPEVVAPLYSQPAIELFLRIPLYRHLEGGRERGLARRAFAGDVPAPILQRLWKDRAPGFHDELVDRNRAFLRGCLLDGVLVREGLLDRGAVYRTFSDRRVTDPVRAAEIFRHLDVELWARGWMSAAGR
jgi:asparagine synthase (glutamine-hydrolysing)